MPELGEVENYRRRWDVARSRPVLEVRLHPRAQVFTGASTRRIRQLAGETLIDSEARGKWMIFRFTGAKWLGIHLGMTGRLWVDGAGEPGGKQGQPRSLRADRVRDGDRRSTEPAEAVVAEVGASRRAPDAAEQEPVRERPCQDPRHDHLRLVTPAGTLVFSDPRRFGRVRADVSDRPPSWWRDMPPAVTSDAFTVERLREFLKRRARSPLKAVLLDQTRFPGIGNWMADEVLWRAGLHPRRRAGSLDRPTTLRLHRTLRFVASSALRTIGRESRALPAGWLFHVRWADGGRCPRTGVPLVRETIAGRTTCWSPGRQQISQ